MKLSFMEELRELPMEAGYEKLFTVEAQDREGNLYFRESSYVRFRIEGPAEIVAVDNGRLMGNEPYKEQGIHLYHGKASVMVKLTGERGRVCLWADAEGMYSACIALCITE